MPGGDHIEVAPAALEAHAARVTAVADSVATASRAGEAVRLDAQAYGKLCVMLPVLLDGLQSVLVDGIDAAAGSLHDTAGRLRTAAGGYQASDTRSGDSFARIRRAL